MDPCRQQPGGDGGGVKRRRRRHRGGVRHQIVKHQLVTNGDRTLTARRVSGKRRVRSTEPSTAVTIDALRRLDEGVVAILQLDISGSALIASLPVVAHLLQLEPEDGFELMTAGPLTSRRRMFAPIANRALDIPALMSVAAVYDLRIDTIVTDWQHRVVLGRATAVAARYGHRCTPGIARVGAQLIGVEHIVIIAVAAKVTPAMIRGISVMAAMSNYRSLEYDWWDVSLYDLVVPAVVSRREW